jgi:hypothetical protein
MQLPLFPGRFSSAVGVPGVFGLSAPASNALTRIKRSYRPAPGSSGDGAENYGGSDSANGRKTIHAVLAAKSCSYVVGGRPQLSLRPAEPMLTRNVDNGPFTCDVERRRGIKPPVPLVSTQNPFAVVKLKFDQVGTVNRFPS